MDQMQVDIRSCTTHGPREEKERRENERVLETLQWRSCGWWEGSGPQASPGEEVMEEERERR